MPMKDLFFNFDDVKREWEKTPMPIKQRKIGFNAMRMVVVALYNQGSFLKQQQFTFSHGNLGNEYQELARHLDDLVADAEPRHLFEITQIEPTPAPVCKTDEEVLFGTLKTILGMKDSDTNAVYARVVDLLRNQKVNEQTKLHERILQRLTDDTTGYTARLMWNFLKQDLPNIRFPLVSHELENLRLQGKLRFKRNKYYLKDE